jgi:hypothetical protein
MTLSLYPRTGLEARGSPVTVSLSDHEAVTASLLLFKSKYV